MKLFTTFLFCALSLALDLSVAAQTSDMVGRWQLVKKSNCLDQGATTTQRSTAVGEAVKETAAAAPQVVVFHDNASAEESSKILNTSRSSKQKKFFYKFNGEILLILDKKTQTISDSYLVDKFSPDSLILSNKSRPCQMRFFVKIKDGETN